MNRTESAFFNALQHAIVSKPLTGELFTTLTTEEWLELHKLSRSQGVLALVFDALEDVITAIPPQIRLQWAFGAMQIEDKCDKQWHLANELCAEYGKNGIKTVVLKGFALSRYYPNPKHRECGDFDCFLLGDFEQGNIIAERLGAKVRFDDYKHSHISYRGLMIENHKFCTSVRGPKMNKQFEVFLQKLLAEEGYGIEPLNNSSIYIPSPTFNALFLIKHTMVHFLYEGIKIRHLLDWACLIKAEGENIDWKIVNEWCKKLHLNNFVDLMNATLSRYFGLELPCMRYPLDYSNVEKFVQSLLHEDTAVYNTTHASIWHQRYAIVKNMIDSRWKFSRIYRKSLLAELFKASWYAIFEKHPKL
jgi:hypothetical protein